MVRRVIGFLFILTGAIYAQHGVRVLLPGSLSRIERVMQRLPVVQKLNEEIFYPRKNRLVAYTRKQLVGPATQLRLARELGDANAELGAKKDISSILNWYRLQQDKLSASYRVALEEILREELKKPGAR